MTGEFLRHTLVSGLESATVSLGIWAALDINHTTAAPLHVPDWTYVSLTARSRCIRPRANINCVIDALYHAALALDTARIVVSTCILIVVYVIR
jgi:hypothetical protein